MSLSPEMTGYIRTGRCPHCGVAILSSAYVSQNRLRLRREADKLALRDRRVLLLGMFLAPSGVRARVVTENGSIQCLNCMKFWFAFAVTATFLRDLATGDPATTGRLAPRSPSSQPTLWVRQATELPASPPRKVDLSECRLVAVAEEKQVEKFLSEQRKRYQNHSGSTVTRELTVTNSFTLTVTTESSELKSHDMDAGITLFGFAQIRGQVERQLSERYSVTLQSTSSVSDKSSVEIKPYSTVEHIIQWKVVTWTGIALLGKPLTFQRAIAQAPYQVPQRAIAQVPYQVPVRLTYDDDFIDVKDVQVKKKRS
jgi:hypothetical protein